MKSNINNNILVLKQIFNFIALSVVLKFVVFSARNDKFMRNRREKSHIFKQGFIFESFCSKTNFAFAYLKNVQKSNLYF
jgi:hypothetical protein